MLQGSMAELPVPETKKPGWRIASRAFQSVRSDDQAASAAWTGPESWPLALTSRSTNSITAMAA